MTKDSRKITEMLDESGEGVDWIVAVLTRQKEKERMRILEEQLRHRMAEN